MQIRQLLLLMLTSSGICIAQQTSGAAAMQPTRATYLKLAAEVDNALHADVLNEWFPRSVDREHGGFHSHFTRDWQWAPSDGKFSVFEGRMTWVASQVVLRDPKRKEEFLPIVHQGLDYLENVMWDKQDGGFFWGLDDAGQITPQFTDRKELYGIGFCIYGAAAAYQATGDPKALELAKKGFLWVDRHAHDPVNGGYFELLTRDGTPVAPSAQNGQIENGPIGPVGYKSMNTHIHLLEAFTLLYQVWPDPTLRARLEEMLTIVRDKICVEPGVMNLYFTNAWQAIPDHDSYGHDVETGYLMLETDEVLHHKASEQTERMAKMLVDHALAYGWDHANGGFFREGTTFGKPEDTLKEWWVECEGLNALLMMHERYGKQNPIYFQRFLEQWAFIKNHTIDSEYHGLYNLTQADGTPITPDKGSIWKAAYHDSRAFWNVRDRLRKLAEAP
ncbi:MAG: AGE family epimerase/isomerase [Terracidiphilus sp.]|jgi:mannobiose 2-epimerase